MYEQPPSGAPAPQSMIYVKRFDDVGAPQGAVKAVSPSDTAELAGAVQQAYTSLFQVGPPPPAGSP